MATKQYKKLGCMDVNPAGGCAFEVQAETADEVMRLAADHGKNAHKMTSVPPEIAAKIKSAIKTVTVNV
jgi:predicted small metal-binding protein